MGDTTTSVTTKREVGERVDVRLNLDSSKTKAIGNGVFETIITTNAVDRYSEVIDPTGIDTANWLLNPVVLYGHDYSALPIGKGISLKQMAKQWKSTFQLAVEEYPFAATVGKLIEGGYLNAVSIGGIVRQWSEDYKTIEKMEMVEFSVVPVPANPQALITGRSLKDMTGKSVEDIREEFEDFSHKVFVDKLKEMPQDDVKDSIKVLKNLIDRLEDSVVQPAASDAKKVKHFILKDAAAVQAESKRLIRTIKLK